MTEKEMQIQQKQEVQQAGEPTKPEKQYVPAVDIFETAEAVNVLAEMPGVSREGVEIELENETLTIRGIVVPEITGGKPFFCANLSPGVTCASSRWPKPLIRKRSRPPWPMGCLPWCCPRLRPPNRAGLRCGASEPTKAYLGDDIQKAIRKRMAFCVWTTAVLSEG